MALFFAVRSFAFMRTPVIEPPEGGTMNHVGLKAKLRTIAGELRSSNAKRTGPCFRPTVACQNASSRRKMDQSPGFAVLCAVERLSFSVGIGSQPATESLQPVAVGATKREDRRGSIPRKGAVNRARREFIQAESNEPILASQAISFYHQVYEVEERGKTLDAAARH